jgi:hypothetical protein
MAVTEEPTQPDGLATQEEANPMPMRRRFTRIKVIGPRPPPGYVSPDSEADVERLVLSDMEL